MLDRSKILHTLCDADLSMMWIGRARKALVVEIGLVFAFFEGPGGNRFNAVDECLLDGEAAVKDVYW